MVWPACPSGRNDWGGVGSLLPGAPIRIVDKDRLGSLGTAEAVFGWRP
jgi:hypothetical protein